MSFNRFRCLEKVHQTTKRSMSVGRVYRKSFTVCGSEDFIQNVLKSDIPMVGDSPSVHLAIVDVEKNADLVHTFEVKAVPAVLAIRDGHVIDKFIGLIDNDMINEMVKKISKPDEV
ncbi:thioredoxin, mitochondrial isoform X2 [Rhopalosiphum maidis]|uniref:thioredoxin, mitochondrial isoform X2 n=1 Tax=Rhopalosiphum maidis TaxID=43146 RepID=UPI000EFFF6B1|nr:thioredoxin, mitochondrial isoform X2 [Rhopalosiphum maidis]